MNRRKWKVIKEDEPDFVKIFENLVQQFLDSNSAPKYEQSLNEWRSNLTYVPNLIDCVQIGKLPNTLFYAALCLQFLIKKYKTQIDSSLIQDIFTGITHRLTHFDDELNQEQIGEFKISRVSLLKTISFLLVYFPDYFDQIHIFSPNDSTILFCFLFEEADYQIPEVSNPFRSRFFSISEQYLQEILKESEMSTDWLQLFKNCLHQTPEISNYGFLLNRLREIPTTTVLYTQFISVFDECISNSYENLSKGAQNFLEHIFDIIFEMLKTLLSPPIDGVALSMASSLWLEIMDFNPDFFADRGSSYGKISIDEKADQLGRIDLFGFLLQSLQIILEHSESKDDFYQIISSLSIPFKILGEKAPLRYVQPIINILIFILDLIDQDSTFIESEELASPFYSFSDNIDNMLIRRFYDEAVGHNSISSIFCIASSNDAVKEKYAPYIAEMILDSSNSFSNSIVFYFIRKCHHFCEDSFQHLVDYALSLLDSLTYDLETSKALICLAKNNYLSYNEERIPQICTLFHDYNIENPIIAVNILESLLWIIYNTGDESAISVHISQIIVSKVSTISKSFYQSKENEEYALNFIVYFVQMIEDLFDELYPVPRNLYLYLNHVASNIINSIDIFNAVTNIKELNSNSDFIHQQITCFLSICIKIDIIPDNNIVINWIDFALTSNPSFYHIKLLSDVIDLFPTEKTLDFILNIGQCEDNEVIAETLTFLKKFIQKSYDSFYSFFKEDYFYGALLSPDMRIIDLTLDCIQLIVQQEVQTNHMFFHNHHQTVLYSITDGVFTSYQNAEITKVIDIWIDILNGRFSLACIISDYIATKIPAELPEFEDFKDAFYYEDESGSNSMAIFKATLNLKTILVV